MMKSIVIGRIGHVQATNSASLNEIFAYRVFKSGVIFNCPGSKFDVPSRHNQFENFP